MIIGGDYVDDLTLCDWTATMWKTCLFIFKPYAGLVGLFHEYLDNNLLTSRTLGLAFRCILKPQCYPTGVETGVGVSVTLGDTWDICVG